MSLPLIRHLAESLINECMRLQQENDILHAHMERLLQKHTSSCSYAVASINEIASLTHSQEDVKAQDANPCSCPVSTINEIVPLTRWQEDSGKVKEAGCISASRAEARGTDLLHTQRPNCTDINAESEVEASETSPRESKISMLGCEAEDKIQDVTLSKHRKIVEGMTYRLTRTNNRVDTGEADEHALSTGAFNLKALVTGGRFELFFGILIFCNAIIMALDAQLVGNDLGFTLHIDGYPSSGEDMWPNATEAFEVLDFVFGLSFMIELFLKVIGLRLEFFRSLWHVLDTLVVVGWLASRFGVTLFLNPMLLRVLRLVRLTRLVRMVKQLEMFDSLRVILRSIIASAPILLWATAILFSIEAMIGLGMTSLLITYMQSPHHTERQRTDVFLLFGTFSRSMITMTELTLGNFAPVAQTLVNNVSELYGHGILVYKMVVGFAIVRVIGGVFLHETFKTAASDDELMVVQKKRAQQKHAEKMMYLMSQADTSQDALISKQEFRCVFSDPNMKVWLAAQEIDVGDIDLLFDLIDNGDGQLTPEELCLGIARLKGPARSFDLFGIMHMITHVSSILMGIETKLEKQAVPTPAVVRV